MTFRTRNSNAPIVAIGEDASKGERPSVTGQLVDVRPSPKYPDNLLYTITLDDGTSVAVAGCASITKHLTAADVNKRVRLTWRGWGRNKSGSPYRDVEVAVDEPPAPLAAAPSVEPPPPDEPPVDVDAEDDDSPPL